LTNCWAAFLPVYIVATAGISSQDINKDVKKGMAADANRDEVVITAEPLPIGSLAPRVVCPTAGAIATFVGTTRDHFEGKRVVRLEVCAAARGGHGA
jgi:hypothetical protein